MDFPLPMFPSTEKILEEVCDSLLGLRYPRVLAGLSSVGEEEVDENDIWIDVD